MKHLENIVATSTRLATFPEEFNLPSLKSLKLQGCQFQRLSQCESQGPMQLRELVIDARLVEIPKSLGQLKCLKRIVARNTSLATFGEELNLPSLKYLELEDCEFRPSFEDPAMSELIIGAPLVEVPKALGRLLKLAERIVAKKMHLATFPEEFIHPSLKYLELHGCQFQRLWRSESEAPLQLKELIIDAPLVELPRSLGQLKHLERIVAKNTHLATFPEEFNLPSLKYLELQGCQFQKMWQCESQAPLQLKELIIDAPLVEFPRSLWQLKHLEVIVAPTFLPTYFCYPPSLKHLKLKDFELDILSDFVAKLVFSQSVPRSSSGSIGNFSLEMLSNFLCNLKNLQHIDMYECPSLKMFPNFFGNLTNLQSIKMVCCPSLKMLPNWFGNLTNLQSIDLSDCESLERLPDSFGNLTNLHHINFEKCKKLEMLPDSFGNLTNLQSIKMVCCPSLKMLPNSFGNLTNLQRIGLSDCLSLERIPDSFGNLTNINIEKCRNLEMHPDSSGNSTNLLKNLFKAVRWFAAQV